MSFKQRARYFEKQYVRPFTQRLKRLLPGAGRQSKATTDLIKRLDSLEARVAELEQVVQEDLGLRLAPPPPIPASEGKD